jgi:hypothetical protein
MKPETSRTKTGIAVVLGIVALFMVARTLLSGGGSAPQPTAPAAIASKGKTTPAAESLDPRLRLDLLANSESVERTIVPSPSRLPPPSPQLQSLEQVSELVSRWH